MNSQEQALAIFEKTGTLRNGHFVFTSGRHSDRYMQCARVFQQAWHAEELCKLLAEKLKQEGIAPDVVIGPALGAIQMAYEVSRHLRCRNLFAERQNGILQLRRSFAIEPGEKVLVVEDVVTTGGTVQEVLALAAEAGGVPVGVGVLVDRSGGSVDFGVPLFATATLSIPSWPPEDCPLCRDGVPLTKPGSRGS